MPCERLLLPHPAITIVSAAAANQQSGLEDPPLDSGNGRQKRRMDAFNALRPTVSDVGGLIPGRAATR